MRNLKIVLATLLLTVGAIVFLSFVSKNYDSRAFARVCYRIDIVIKTADVNNNVGTARTDFANAANWSIITPAPGGRPQQCDAAKNVCAICYDAVNYGNLQAALTALLAALDANQITLADGSTYFNTGTAPKPITFYERTTNP